MISSTSTKQTDLNKILVKTNSDEAKLITEKDRMALAVQHQQPFTSNDGLSILLLQAFHDSERQANF